LLTAVAIARPQNGRQAAALALLLVSPAVLLGINRGNQDAIIFIVMSLGFVCLRRGQGVAPWLGVILEAATAVLKYFPLVNLVLLLGFRTRRKFILGLLLYGCVLALGAPGVIAALRFYAGKAAMPDWLYAFGAPMLLRDLGVRAAVGWLVPAGLLALWLLFLGRRAWQSTAAPSESFAAGEFMCAAAMIAGVFFLGASYAYKLIFAVWLLPWLWREDAVGPERRWERLTCGLLFGVAWGEGLVAIVLNLLFGMAWVSESAGLGILKAALVVTQLATWLLVACLLRFVVWYVVRRLRILFAGSPLSGNPA
jgi:hypothetical protein